MACYVIIGSVYYLGGSITGKVGHNNFSQMENSGGSSDYSRYAVHCQSNLEQNSDTSEILSNGKRDLSRYYNNYLWFGPKGNGGRYLQICN